MRSISWRLGLAAACAALTLVGQATRVSGADEDSRGIGNRLERLEQRIDQLAQQQEKLMHGIADLEQRQAPMAAAGPENLRRANTLRERVAVGQRMLPAGVPSLAPAPAPEQAPAPNINLHKKLADLLGLCFVIGVIFNILIAVWIFTDIRKRGEGPGIFIVLALLAGIPTAIIYAIVRLGDKKP